MLFRGAFGAGAETRWAGCRALLLPGFFLTFICRVCLFGAATTRGCCLVLLTVLPVRGERFGALACAAERCLVASPDLYDLDCRLLRLAGFLVFDGCTEAIFVGLSVLPTPPNFDLRFDLRPALL